MKALLTHPGTQYAPMLASQLHRTGTLSRYVTGISFVKQGSALFRGLLRLTRTEKLAGRRQVDIPIDKLYRIVWPDLWSLYRMRAGHERDKLFYESNGWFQKLVPEDLLKEADAVIGFDTASWILAKRSREAGRPFIMDISIGHPLFKEQVFEVLRQRFPAWQNEVKPKRPENLAVELEEMQLADHFVAATEFTKTTYITHGIPGHKISMNPYGTDLGFFYPKEPADRQPGEEISFLYFSKISARKGFPWLCKVWEAFHSKFPHTKLIAAGYGQIPKGFKLPAGIEMAGFIHPNDRAALFHSVDVFVFPSFFEGFGQVIIEAMACGLPVITTTNTVGPEIIDDFDSGFIVDPGNDEALSAALEYFGQHPEVICQMGANAREKVLPYTWDAYGDRWKNILEVVGQQ